MKLCALAMTLFACACPAKPATHTGGGSAGSDTTAPVTSATTCDGVKAKVEGLYRAEAQQKEPKRVDEAVSDNTTMVMNDCVKDPAKFVPCLNKAATIAEIEKQCLIPLDDEGTEGERTAR
jgi:hypothetical protein